MTKKILLAICTASLLLGGLGSANAALIGVMNQSGLQGQIIPAPSVVVDSTLGSNEFQLGFDEQQGVLLNAPIQVDNNGIILNGGVIAAGTIVNSHMIFLNRDTTDPTVPARLNAVNDWKFDGKILGVMSDSPGVLESLTNNLLGAPGTGYPAGGFPARGLEGDPSTPPGPDFYSINAAMDTLRVGMRVSEPGDWIRVVTAPVPVPSAMLLFGTGLVGLIAFRGMKKKS